MWAELAGSSPDEKVPSRKCSVFCWSGLSSHCRPDLCYWSWCFLHWHWSHFQASPTDWGPVPLQEDSGFWLQIATARVFNPRDWATAGSQPVQCGKATMGLLRHPPTQSQGQSNSWVLGLLVWFNYCCNFQVSRLINLIDSFCQFCASREPRISDGLS